VGCNCGKAKRPLAPTKPQPNPATSANMPVPPPNGQQTTPPPTSGTTQSFALTSPDSRVQTFGSMLEAQAARVRGGGSGRISTVGG